MDIREEALAVQDACNLRAIARLLVKAADAVTGGTQATYDDPAVILIVNKIESLVRSNEGMRFSVAFDACIEDTKHPSSINALLDLLDAEGAL